MALEFEDMLYEQPVASVAFLLNNEGIMVGRAFTAKQDKYDAGMVAYEKERELRGDMKKMDGICVSNAIAATCGPAIAFLVGREADKRGATMQPKGLWAFLEETTRVALISARVWLQE